MSFSMSQASVAIYAQQLNSLLGLLDKAAEHCRAKGVNPSELIQAQLAPDMFPFSRQIQIATDQAKGATARLSGREIPKFEDTEATFDELKARIAKTLDFIKSVPARDIDGSEEKDVTITVGGQPRTLKGERYLVHNSLPNFFFHVTTAYDILRHKGVEIGKRDYLGTY
jgi:uncharacterized protein